MCTMIHKDKLDDVTIQTLGSIAIGRTYLVTLESGN